MVEFFQSGGLMMWPIVLVAVGILWLTVRTTWLIQRRHRPEEADLHLQGILFWGAMSVVLGLIGTVVGWIQMTRAIARAESVQAQTVWVGIGVTFTTFTFGILIFTVAAICWFLLRQWSTRALVND